MLIRGSDMPPEGSQPQLQYVLGELAKAFRPGRRPHPCDPDSKRNAFYSMCTVCVWQREFDNSQRASEIAMKHGEDNHGDPFAGMVRIEAR